jgi:PAS domain S-box-containing protein
MLGPVEDMLARSFTELSPAAKGQLEVVKRNGQKLLRLVNTLLDFSRIEAGRVRAVYQPTDLAAFTTDLASVFRAAVERAGLRLVVDCPKLSGLVFVDRDMWEKIVLNLLSNAFKFTFDGEIAVTLRQVGQTAQLLVRDTGTGIPAAEVSRLFERFHRVQNARGRTHEGSGIGLALVQELIKLHGGSIVAESKVGQGTTFAVTVPLGADHLPPDHVGNERSLASSGTGASAYVEEALRWLPDELQEATDLQSELAKYQEPLPSAYAEPNQGESDNRPCVLVADDNADMRQYVVRLLAERYRVEAVPDGEAALVAVREHQPDLILSDVMMPRLDGFGLLRQLRDDPERRNIPVLLLSARAGEESRVDGMEAGADDYLVKPFGARELLARVSAHLQMAQLRREANELLQHQKEQFETLLNQAPLGVYLIDADFRMRQVNPTALPFFGDISDLIGRDFDEVTHILWTKDYADEVVRIFRHTLETGEPYSTPERSEHRLDRRVTEYYEWRIDRIPLPDGRYGVVCYFSDVSRHVLARQALAASEKALKDADLKKNEFLSILAHELRNPLAPIRNGLQLLKLAKYDANIEQARIMMERQLNQMVRLIDDLMDLTRISSGKIALKKARVPLAAAVQNAVEMSCPLIEAAGHDLILDVPDESIYVDADLIRLSQVFTNLLNNAAKYTERGGRIRLAVERQESAAVVTVEDNGVGIPAHMLSKIFDMFTQVDRSLERAQGGLGIGLNIVKRLVEMHGGTIEAHSGGHGMGSKFIVRLPVVLALASEQPGDEVEEKAAPTARRRILVVDDNRDSAITLAMMLKMMGNDTQTAHDGLEALDVGAAFRPDVILLDIGMPKLNGYDAARRIRREPWGKTAVLVAVTGWGQEEDKQRSQEAGFNLHMVKPVEPAALEKLLAGLKATTA